MVADDGAARGLLGDRGRDDRAAGLEEDELAAGRRPRPPAECLVERPRTREVGDAERHEAEALVHAGMMPRTPFRTKPCVAASFRKAFQQPPRARTAIRPRCAHGWHSSPWRRS